MYRQHFGLGEHPFSLTPDTQFFFDSESHCQILSTVLLALRHSEGFIKIVGEVGTGKTLLSRMLLAGLGENFKTAYIPNPYLTPEELKWFLAEELGIAYSPAMPSYQLLKEINQRLIELAHQHQQVVLVVDEAQAMPRETLEALRLLTNLETEKNKLLQVVLIGQPELDEMLNRPDLRQLKQRIVFAEYLQGISRKKMASYIASRLGSAGYTSKELFSRSATALLYRASGGVPRLINVIAHKAMLVAYGEKSERVTRAHVASAIAETQESRSVGRVFAKQFFWFWPSAAIVASLSALLLFSNVTHYFNPLMLESAGFNSPNLLAANIDENKKIAVVIPEKVMVQSVVDKLPVNDQQVSDINASDQTVNDRLENDKSENILPEKKQDLQQQQAIVDLLQHANRALASDRLTSPIEDNAFGYYQKVLQIEPNDLQAKAGLALIAARYLEKAQAQLRVGNLSQAATFKQRANVVAPEYYREHEKDFLSPDIQVAEPEASTVIKSFDVTEAATLNITPNMVGNDEKKDEQIAAQAKALMQENKTAQAIELLKNVIASEEKPIQSASVLADIYLQQGDASAAIKTLEAHLTAADNNEQYGAFLASLYHKTGRYQQSVVSYQRLLKRYGEKPAYWLGLALAFDGLAQPNNALQAYQHLQEFPQLQVQVKHYTDKRIAALSSE